MMWKGEGHGSKYYCCGDVHGIQDSERSSPWKLLVFLFQIESIMVESLLQLPLLACLDLQNNSITHVPPQLGNVTSLKCVVVCQSRIELLIPPSPLPPHTPPNPQTPAAVRQPIPYPQSVCTCQRNTCLAGLSSGQNTNLECVGKSGLWCSAFVCNVSVCGNCFYESCIIIGFPSPHTPS